ncbi:MAG: hypothetical protein V1810_00290 [Candidatus Beckwithbacteria bacterium]
MTEVVSKGRDPVIEQRIHETTESCRAEIEKINQRIATLQAQIEKSPFLRLKQKMGQNFNGKQQLGNLKSEIRRRLCELEEIPGEITRQIKNNRRSYQLFWIRNFLGDPADINQYRKFEVWNFWRIGKNFPYDGGNDENRLDQDEKRVRFPKDIIQKIRDTLKTDGKIKLTLYDTSDPRPQMRHESFIDLLVELGFAIDESMQRGIAAMHADTGINIHALERFKEQSPFKSGWRFAREDWLDFNPNGSVSGYLRAEGDRAFADKRPDLSQSLESNPVLSKLCHEWQVPHLYAELTYQRTNQDIKVELDVQKEIDLIDIKPLDSRPALLP